MNAPFLHGPAGRLLIINADDFGAAEEINEAVEISHRSGILTSASLMVGGAAASDAIARARALPTLRVGLHVALVDARPCLNPEEIPGLIDRSGRLRSDVRKLAFDIALSARLRRQMRAEIKAQFEAFARSGLKLDHADAHKHFHLHPVVAREIIAIGREFGLEALRVPSEFGWTLVSPWLALLRAQARRARLMMPDAVFGLRWSGAFTAERMLELLRDLPPGVIELYLHPAIANRFCGSVPGYRYREEFEALCAPAVVAAIKRAGLRLGGYADANPSLVGRE
ncbi:MAG TPA: hopanoid biosynthesis-associated protein HpnK [Methylovirgula sp.]|nr:hopanoid biosynthesis-associated protein HpnK [Methylovirgula sp.]